MSPVDITAPDRLPLSAQLLTLLRLLYGHCRPGTLITCHVGRGSATNAYHAPAGVPIDVLPAWLLREFRYRTVDDLVLLPATTNGSGEPRDLGALVVEIPTPPAQAADGALRVPAAVAMDAWARLDNVRVPAAVVIDAGWSLVACWPLARPLSLRAARTRAEFLQRTLAERLGGLQGEVAVARPSGQLGHAQVDTLPGWSPCRPMIPLPGSLRRDRTEAPLVTLRRCTDTRVALEDLERAITPAPRRRASRRTA